MRALNCPACSLWAHAWSVQRLHQGCGALLGHRLGCFALLQILRSGAYAPLAVAAQQVCSPMECGWLPQDLQGTADIVLVRGKLHVLIWGPWPGEATGNHANAAALMCYVTCARICLPSA